MPITPVKTLSKAIKMAKPISTLMILKGHPDTTIENCSS